MPKRFDETKLDSLMALVGMDKVRLEGDRIIKADPDMFIDVNAIAQGYTVDLLVDLLGRRELMSAWWRWEARCALLATREAWDGMWVLTRPLTATISPAPTLQAKVRLDNRALATSGNYRKFYVENGVKYSHTIDPRTGYPVRHTLLSATVIAPECAVADAWATACMVAGKGQR